MLYLDTSLLVTALTNEPDSPKVQAWLNDQDVDDIYISDWVVTEFSAALSMKVRSKKLSAELRVEALADFDLLARESFGRISIGQSAFAVAASFANQTSLGLRAGDALHLAIASAAHATLCTRDKRLAGAGLELSVGTILL